jgi:hypothetical protein
LELPLLEALLLGGMSGDLPRPTGPACLAARLVNRAACLAGARPRYRMARLATLAAMPASTALAIGDARMSAIGLDPDARA